MDMGEPSNRILSSMVVLHNNTSNMAIAHSSISNMAITRNNISNTVAHSNISSMAMHNHLNNTTPNLLNPTGAAIQLHPGAEDTAMVADIASAVVVVVDTAVEAAAVGIAVVEADMAVAGDAKT